MSISESLATKCMSSKIQPRTTTPTLIDLNPDKYSQGLHYYPHLVKMNRYNGSCNTFLKISQIKYVSNKTEDINLHVFNMVTKKMNQKH